MSKSLVARLRSFLVVAVIAAVTAAVALEAIYRLQIVDTYRSELRTYNPAEALEDDSGRPTVLVLGDSFSAGNANWVAIVREEQDDYRVINAAVSGTGIKQAGIMAPGRIRSFRPQVFVYQIYVGNDLYDIRYPVNSETMSPLRNAFWAVSDHLISLPFLNYRLGQAGFGMRRMIPDDRVEIIPMRDRMDEAREPFSVAKYAAREKLLLLAEPHLIENSALLRGGREEDFRFLLKELGRMLRRLPDDCPAILVVIPHCAQVTPGYLERMKSIGAKFDDEQAVLAETSPFVAELRAYVEREELNASVLDVLPMLRDAEDSGVSVYLPNDPHLDEVGQRLLAETVLDALSPPPASRRDP
ncbi:MAG TPA: hypothetical protein VKU85_19140 [bacterium]|nr:hypothetical protein [bacterium]